MTQQAESDPGRQARPRRAWRLVTAAAVWILPIGLVPMLALAQQGESERPPRFEEVCFGDFDDRQEYPKPAPGSYLPSSAPWS